MVRIHSSSYIESRQHVKVLAALLFAR